jgi:HAD superfamily hydrolase (TIGR01484 family)
MTPILATDLDGTLIPVTPMSPAANASSEYRATESNRATTSDSALAERAALATFRRLSDAGEIEIIFVTGRHPSSVIGVISDEGLPSPQWIICDVGTTILRRVSGKPYHPIEAYVNHLDAIIGQFTTAHLRSKIVQHADLSPQEDEKQGRHKLSYYCDASKLHDHVARIDDQIDRLGAPYRTVGSVDPFNGDGLIDLLPRGTDKSSALEWWANHRVAAKEQIVFAGDSGNDFAALTSGFRAILVGNADRELAARVVEHHQEQGTADRIYLATGRATAGVLEGCIEYGIISPSAIEQS